MSKRKTYSAQFKFQLVLECLNGIRSDAEIACGYAVHPITLSKWKTQFLDHGSEVFGGKEEVKRSEERQAQLERVLGQKEVEIALLKNFLGNAWPWRRRWSW